MIGLLDWDIYNSTSTRRIIPNLEIMKLYSYYLREENQFCKLLTPDTIQLDNYEKIYFFSEAEIQPKIPNQYNQAQNVIFGGTAFTKQYEPFKNSLIDYMPANTQIYKEFLKQKYQDGIKAKIINDVLDNSYYRMYVNNNKLPIPPIYRRKHLILYDKNILINNWQEIFKEIESRAPASIITIHPVECINLTDFFALRLFNKFSRENNIILNLNIPLEQISYMLKKYKNVFLAEITKNSNIFLPLGGDYKTKELYYKDFIYKINLLYSFWSRGITIKIKVKPCSLGFNNPIYNLEKKMEEFHLTTERNRALSLNNKIPKYKKNNILAEEKMNFLKLHPSALELFNQSFEELKKRGDWRI